MGRITISISHPRDATKRIRAQIRRPGCAATTNTRIEFISEAGCDRLRELRLRKRPKVGWRNAVFRCGLICRGNPKERWLGKRPSEEHNPHGKLCRNGACQARTTRSPGVADPVKYLSREPRRDGKCRNALLSKQTPDRCSPAV